MAACLASLGSLAAQTLLRLGLALLLRLLPRIEARRFQVRCERGQMGTGGARRAKAEGEGGAGGIERRELSVLVARTVRKEESKGDRFGPDT